MPVTVLDRPLYSTWEAALLLGIPGQTLRRWLDGAHVRGVHYPPVIRPQPTGSDSVTWAEFVEAGFLRGYRNKKVPLQKMRPFIERARVRSGVPYPLAHFKPLIDNKQIVYDLQRETGLDAELFLVRAEGEQLFWAEPIREFLEKVEFSPETDVVVRLRPLGRDSPVAIDPDVSFGVPQIRGIRTELVAESVRAGGIREATAAWGLSASEVNAALAWENRLSRAA